MDRLGTDLRRLALVGLARLVAAGSAQADIIVMTGVAGGARWLIS